MKAIPVCKGYGPGNPANSKVVFVPGVVTMWFSYETLIAFRVDHTDAHVGMSPNNWGATTGKHLKAIEEVAAFCNYQVQKFQTREAFEKACHEAFKQTLETPGTISLDVELTVAEEPKKTKPKNYLTSAGLRRFEKAEGKWTSTDHLLWVPGYPDGGCMLVIPQDETKMPTWNKSVKPLHSIDSGSMRWAETEPNQADHEIARRMLKNAKA